MKRDDRIDHLRDASLRLQSSVAGHAQQAGQLGRVVDGQIRERPKLPEHMRKHHNPGITRDIRDRIKHGRGDAGRECCSRDSDSNSPASRVRIPLVLSRQHRAPDISNPRGMVLV